MEAQAMTSKPHTKLQGYMNSIRTALDRTEELGSKLQVQLDSVMGPEPPREVKDQPIATEHASLMQEIQSVHERLENHNDKLSEIVSRLEI